MFNTHKPSSAVQSADRFNLRQYLARWFFLRAGGVCYGSAYRNGTMNITMTTLNTWYEVTAGGSTWAAGPINNCTFADPRITAPNAGIYLVNWSLAGLIGTAAQRVMGCILVDGTIVQDMGQAAIEYETANIDLTMASTGLITLAAGQTVSLGIRNITSGGVVYTFFRGSITIVQTSE